MRMSDLDYHLPPERIAAHPVEPRDRSRLMVLHRAADRVEHRHFSDLPEYLLPTDLLIVNDTRVLPAKLELRKPTGAAIPGLFVSETAPGQWQVMLRTRGKVRAGAELLALRQDNVPPYRFTLIEKLNDEKGMWRVAVSPVAPAREILAEIGHVPLPPYIEKMRPGDGSDDESRDREHYQTVYARSGASVAAPTAGLHFTPELLDRLTRMGVRRAAVELDVGLGTFLPVETETLEAHPMHTETYAVPPATVRALRQQRKSGQRIVVVGTTAVRTLETTAPEILGGDSVPRVEGLRGSTDLKIMPGFQFRLTDVLITNFHLPKSTLMALVAALIGLERLHALYALAIRGNYRFYSYGDAMLILP